MCSYLFNTYSVREQIKATATGSTVRHTAPDRIYSVRVDVPPLPTQRRIAGILSAYDDLIENNTRRIAILEEMAQLIYREWFVHYRFPGHEQVEMVELELVPEGWKAVKVQDIVKRLRSGTQYKQADILEKGVVPVVDQSRDIILGFHNNNPDHLASPEHPIIIFGDHTCKMQLMVEPFSVGPNVVPFVSEGDIPVMYLYYLVNSLVETQEYKRHWTELMNKVIVLSTLAQANRFSDLVKPFFEQIDTLTKNLSLELRPGA